MSTQSFPVIHHTIRVQQPFEEVARRIEGQLSRFDLVQLRAPHDHVETWRAADGFMLFNVVDHGALLGLAGAPRKMLQYVLGNPLFALEMTKHDPSAALYAPLRMLVREDGDETVVEYDLPSSLFGRTDNADVLVTARALDDKMARLVAALGAE